jgi:hypothetical protein
MLLQTSISSNPLYWQLWVVLENDELSARDYRVLPLALYFKRISPFNLLNDEQGESRRPMIDISRAAHH